MAEDAGLISGAVAARLLTLTPEEFRKLDRAGWFERAGKDAYRVVDVVQGHIRYLKKQADETGRTVAQVANHIGLTQRRLFELLDKGVIKRHGKEGYSLGEARAEYIRHLRESAAGRGDGYVDLPIERALLAREQTQSMALRNAIARGEYASVETLARMVEGLFAVVRERLFAIPGKIAEFLVGRTRDEIERALRAELNEVLQELNDSAELARRAALAEASGMRADAEAATGAQSH
jgi:terminase small subunit / prophage DNA-packing protein